MKKQITLASALLVTCFLLPTPALAEESTTPTPTRRPGLLDRFRNQRQELRQETKEKRDELKGTITQDRNTFRRQKMTQVQHGLLNGFTVRVQNLERATQMIADRITQKLAKLPGNQALLDAQKRLGSTEYNALWATHQTDLAKFKATIEEITTILDPTSLLSELKSEAKQVNTDLKAIRQYLVATLRMVVQAK